MLQRLERAEAGLARLLEGVAVVLMASLVVVIAYSVFGRQVLRISVPWSEEVGAGLLLWTVALGAAAVWYRRGHIAIDVFLRALPLSGRYVAMILIELVSLLLFAVAFAGAYSMMFVSANTTTTALRISYTYLYLGLAVGLGAMILFSVMFLLRLVARGPAGVATLKKGDEWSTLSSS